METPNRRVNVSSAPSLIFPSSPFGRLGSWLGEMTRGGPHIDCLLRVHNFSCTYATGTASGMAGQWSPTSAGGAAALSDWPSPC